MARHEVAPYVGPQLLSGVALAETDAAAIGIDAPHLLTNYVKSCSDEIGKSGNYHLNFARASLAQM